MHITIRAEELLPVYINPASRDYSTYHDSLRAFNLSLQERVAKMLAETFRYNGEVAFTTTGSDGRREKGPQSRVELLVIKSGDRMVGRAVRRVRDIITDATLRDVFGYFEVKDLEQDNLSYFENDPQRVYPSRVIDASFLSGDFKILESARHKIFEEVTGIEGNRIRNYVSTGRRQSKNTALTGKNTFRGRTVVHYDLESGIAYFGQKFEGTAASGSFKYGPLRFVQYAFIENLVRHLQEKKNPKLLHRLPTNTVERFLFLESEELLNLSRQEVSDVVDSYKYFLWLFHLSQFNFRDIGSAKTEFDKAEAKERIDSLISILNRHFLS